MKPGIYALASLDGSPLSDEDLEILTLGVKEGGQNGTFRSRVISEQVDSSVVDEKIAPEESLLFLGYLNELEDAQQVLGEDATCSPAQIAAKMQDLFPAEAANLLHGDWSFLRWVARGRELTLSTSLVIRDQLYWTSNGRHIAVAPDMLLLAKLPWVGRKLNPKNLALYLSNFRIRQTMRRETVWEEIFRVPAGSCIRFSQATVLEISSSHHASEDLWHGSFDEAVEQLTWIGRRIIGQAMTRAEISAFLLSGGIDSSLTTLLGSYERGSSKEMFCLTSIAPLNSDLHDEWEISQSVSQHLGIPHFPVLPAPDFSPYLPEEKEFRHEGQPIVGPRHYLYDQFGRQAKMRGANVIIDGAAGELTLSQVTDPNPMVSWPRRIVRSYRAWKSGSRYNTLDLRGALLVRFSREFIADLPCEWHDLAARPPFEQRSIDPDGRKGIEPWIAKSIQAGTGRPDGVRYVYPFLDQRLLRFASQLPRSFFTDEKADRKLARALLRGHVADVIVDRNTHHPISPNFRIAMKEKAENARSRIPLFRDAGLSRILDLDWLDAALRHLARGGDAYSPELCQAQSTCMVGEFLFWNRNSTTFFF